MMNEFIFYVGCVTVSYCIGIALFETIDAIKERRKKKKLRKIVENIAKKIDVSKIEEFKRNIDNNMNNNYNYR